MKGVTPYSGLSQFYFRHLLKQIIKVGRLDRSQIRILDFGCGRGELKRILGEKKVIGYDIIRELSDVLDWREVDFDVLVANQVFYSFSEKDLECLLQELREKNHALELVIGVSRQGILNNIGKYLLAMPNAHEASKLTAKQEMKIFEKYCELIVRKSFILIADVYLLRFKN